MSINVQIPPLGESVTEAVLLRWLKDEGASVKADEPLCELETDKANVELPSPGAGVLKQLKKPGQTVKIGDVVARVDEAGAMAQKAAPAKSSSTAAPAATKPNPPSEESRTSSPKPSLSASAEVTRPAVVVPPPPGKIDTVMDAPLSPSVRRLVREHHVDTEALSGTGPRGRVTKEDVLNYVEHSGTTLPVIETPSVTPAKTNTSVDEAGTRREPMSKLRKKIAERLVQAQRAAAMLTTFNEIDMSAVMELREKYKTKFQETYGVSLGLMSFFARAAVVALHEFPLLNAFIDGNDILYHDYVHLGMAVSTDRGLVVPVMRHAEKMSFAKVESEIKRTAAAAREGKLNLDELSGGTFTLTNGGVFGSLMSTPILNPPQSGILGLHAIQKRPKVVDDKIEIRPMMYVALSYDHRIVDGKDSVRFLVKVKESLEDPTRLMLEI